jgi:ferredoxin-type protein NapG
VAAHHPAHGGVTGAALSGFLPLVYARTKRLRPPGALDEKDFLASCIKCGQCVQVCPVQAIKLADLVDGFGVGVPYIDAREQACDFSCDAVQCILACPTGALVYKKPAFPWHRKGAMRWPPSPSSRPRKRTRADAEPEGAHRRCAPDAPRGLPGRSRARASRARRAAPLQGQMRYMDVDRWKPIKVATIPTTWPNATCACASARSRARSASRPSSRRRQQAQVAGGA